MQSVFTVLCRQLFYSKFDVKLSAYVTCYVCRNTMLCNTFTSIVNLNKNQIKRFIKVKLLLFMVDERITSLTCQQSYNVIFFLI